jgi:hypothetical protein
MNEGIIIILYPVTEEIEMERQLFNTSVPDNRVRKIPFFLVKLNCFDPVIKHVTGKKKRIRLI